MIYSSQDLVRAYGLTTVLAKNLKLFCELWRKHCNGINDVVVPKGKFLVHPVGFVEDETRFMFTVISIEQEQYTREVYDMTDVDLGDRIEPSYVFETQDVWKGARITIPSKWLFSEISLENELIELAKKEHEKKKQRERAIEIEQLEKRLARLKWQA